MGSATIPTTQFSTREFEDWRESIDVVFDVERPPDEARQEFSAHVDAFQLGDIVVTSAELDGQRYVRSPAKLRRDGMDHFVLNLYRTGGWQAQTAFGEFEGTKGQVSVLDLASDLISDEPASSLVALFVPRSLLETRLPNLGALHGRAPAGPYGVFLAEYLDLLAKRLPTLPATNEQALGRATCEMLIACLGPSLANVEAARPALELVLRRRAERYIEERLKWDKLDVDAISGAIGVSRRTLFRLFENAGGVQHYIQNRRLEGVRQELVDFGEVRRISEIAAEYGFRRSDHFARVFKRRFGHSASDARDCVLCNQQVDARSYTEAGEWTGFGAWIKQLGA